MRNGEATKPQLNGEHVPERSVSPSDAHRGPTAQLPTILDVAQGDSPDASPLHVDAASSSLANNSFTVAYLQQCEQAQQQQQSTSSALRFAKVLHLLPEVAARHVGSEWGSTTTTTAVSSRSAVHQFTSEGDFLFSLTAAPSTEPAHISASPPGEFISVAQVYAQQHGDPTVSSQMNSGSSSHNANLTQGTSASAAMLPRPISETSKGSEETSTTSVPTFATLEAIPDPASGVEVSPFPQPMFTITDAEQGTSEPSNGYRSK